MTEKKTKPCPDCLYNDGFAECPSCDGDCVDEDGNECWACDGQGAMTCETCDGTEVVEVAGE